MHWSSRLLLPFVMNGAGALAFAAGSIGVTTVTPSSIPVKTSTAVLVTASIVDPSLIAGSVNLQRMNANGTGFVVLGVMHDDGLNGDAAAGDGIYSLRLTLNEPSPFPVQFRISAAFQGSLTRSFSPVFLLNVTGSPAPAITITNPSSLAFLNTSPVTVSGTVSDSSATVTVNGIAAPASGGSFSVAVPLIEGNNTLTVVAANSQGTTSTASVQVTLDTTPPRITIYSPADGFLTSATSTTVTGVANDVVVGTVNPQQVKVTVNGIDAQVANRSFQALNVPLTPGSNVIKAVARDRAGNGATAQITVQRTVIAEPQIVQVSGDNQSAAIQNALSSPLVVALVDGSGSPVSGQQVAFTVTRNNGTLDGGVSTLSVTTDSAGQAKAHLTLGGRSGAGSNLVTASAFGFAGTVIFTASGLPATAAQINVDAGSDQNGLINRPLPHPFVAVVTDAGHNRLPNVPVTFTVTQGGGNLNGQSTLTTNTDPDGRALAILTPGPQSGVASNIVQANFAGNPGFAATFTATGLVEGNPANTRISGVVLDNSNNPVPGATIRAYQNVSTQTSTGLQALASVQSDPQGQFFIEPAPVGEVKLTVDGSTVQRPGKWPNLEYEMVTVPGQNNTAGLPIHLLPLNLQSQVCVTQATGGTVNIPQVPGFAMTILPGSATFPGGSKTGCVTVTTVHPDKVPMVPGFGQQPRFIVTIQPAGTLFSPPAPITIPNVEGLAPREVTEMYSFDHDLATFVAIGTGTVSDDGSVIGSDPGVGVFKAGWFCGGNPSPTGSAGVCPQCQKCNGSACVPDPAQEGKSCKRSDNKPGVCKNGQCVPVTVEINVNGTPATDDDITALMPPQTIPAKITLHGGGGQSVPITLTISNQASLGETSFSLVDGGSKIVTITPLLVSNAVNDVTITATVDGDVVGTGHLTIVNVTFPPIRAPNTPAKMAPDRIPPRVDTTLTITLKPDLGSSGQKVTLATLNTGGAFGKFTIGGSATEDITTTTAIALSGTVQTAATISPGPGGNAGNLRVVAQVRGQNTAQSSGFSVAAIPQNFTDAPAGEVNTPQLFGLIVQDGWSSDSGVPGDLDAVDIKEQVQVGLETGVFYRQFSVDKSDYIPATHPTQDDHTVKRSLITSDGTATIYQVSTFRDARTGVTDIPMTHSGFIISLNAVENAKTHVVELTTSKVGAAATAHDFSSEAGQALGLLSVTQP